jgi:hypothetical protein
MSENRITINLFGMSCRIYLFALNAEQVSRLEQFSALNKVRAELALLDPELPEYMGEEGINTLSDLSSELINGMIADYSSKIEIRWNGIKKRSIPYEEIVNNQTIFPLFQVKMSEQNLKHHFNYMVMKHDIGLLASYSFEIKKRFNLNELAFDICRLSWNNNSLQVLQHLYYRNTSLVSKRNDTLVRTSYAIKL